MESKDMVMEEVLEDCGTGATPMTWEMMGTYPELPSFLLPTNDHLYQLNTNKKKQFGVQ